MIDSSLLTVIILSEKNVYNTEWINGNCSQIIFCEVFCHVYDKIPGHTINEKIFRAIRNVEKCRKYVWIIVDDGGRMLYNTKKNTEGLNTICSCIFEPNYCVNINSNITTEV